MPRLNLFKPLAFILLFSLVILGAPRTGYAQESVPRYTWHLIIL